MWKVRREKSRIVPFLLGYFGKYWQHLRRTEVCAQLLSCVGLFAAPSTVVCQAPLPIEFSRQEYWSGLPLPRDHPNPGIEPQVSCISCIARWILYHWEDQRVKQPSIQNHSFNFLIFTTIPRCEHQARSSRPPEDSIWFSFNKSSGGVQIGFCQNLIVLVSAVSQRKPTWWNFSFLLILLSVESQNSPGQQILGSYIIRTLMLMKYSCMRVDSLGEKSGFLCCFNRVRLFPSLISFTHWQLGPVPLQPSLKNYQ